MRRTVDAVRTNGLFRDVTVSSLIRTATLEFCERILAAHDVMSDQPKNGKDLVNDILARWK